MIMKNLWLKFLSHVSRMQFALVVQHNLTGGGKIYVTVGFNILRAREQLMALEKYEVFLLFFRLWFGYRLVYNLLIRAHWMSHENRLRLTTSTIR